MTDKKLIWPLMKLTITSPYGPRVHPVTGIQTFHYGVDFAAPVGELAKMVHGGQIVLTKNDKTSGIYLVLQWNEGADIYKAVYCHLSKIIKNSGIVSAGEVTCLTGASGRITGPHLHFGLMKNGEWVNPMDYFEVRNG